MGAQDERSIAPCRIRGFVEFHSAAEKFIYNIFVMNDFMKDSDGERSIFHSPGNQVDRAPDPGTESPFLCQMDLPFHFVRSF